MKQYLSDNKLYDVIKFVQTDGGTWCQQVVSAKSFFTNKFMKKWTIEARMSANNKELFKELFGEQHFCITTWYRGWYWVFEYEGFFFTAMCSVRGTDYRVYPKLTEGYTDRKLKKVTNKFLKEFMEYMIETHKKREV